MKVGTLVHIAFKDHCFTKGGATPPLHCEVVGWVTYYDADSIVIAPWIVQRDLTDENNDTYTLLRHKGMKITQLRHSLGVFSE